MFLTSAKEQVGHGRWLDWIRNNVKFGARNVQLYMRLANAKHVAHLDSAQSLRQVYHLLGQTKASEPTGITARTDQTAVKPIITIEAVLGLPWRRWKRDVFDAHKDKADLSRVQRWREYTKPVREVDEWCEKVEQQLMGVNK
jgi:hypothetical protein